MKAADLRTRRITIDVNEAEWSRLDVKARKARTGLRTFVREAALRVSSAPTPAVPTQADFDTAAILTRVAESLAQIAEAAGRGVVFGILPDLARELADAAHRLGLRIIGVRRAR